MKNKTHQSKKINFAKLFSRKKILETIIKKLESIGLECSEIQYFINAGTPRTIKKGELMTDEIALVQEGLLCRLRLDEKGKKKATHFFLLPDFYFAFDYRQIILELPSHCQIEALEDTKILAFSRKTMGELFSKNPNLLKIRDVEFLKLFVAGQRLIEMFQNCNALERLQLVKQKAPSLLSRVPYVYLASFLGLHRNTFAKALQEL